MNKTAKHLFQRIQNYKAKISVIGMGYVGMPLAHAFSQNGYEVTGIDLDLQKIHTIQSGKSHIPDVPSESIKTLVKKNKLHASQSFAPLSESDVVIVCVPTPLNRAKDPDMSFIISATDEILKHLHEGQLIILESTTYPGTTEEVIMPALERSGLKTGADFFLCFSPERIDPGNPNFHTRNIPKVVGGITETCTELAATLYEKITSKALRVSSPRTAEMAKLLENTFRIVNIGLINELACAASKLKINIWEVIEAAKTKPFGFMPFYPGPGIGGHCIGVDPLYLSWKAKLLGANLHFIDLAQRMNAAMPRHVVSEAVYALNRHRHKAISKSRILILGVSYKKDVPDIRESPALDIIHEIQLLGAKVDYHDPYVPDLKHEDIHLQSVSLTPKRIRTYDLVIIVTDHTRFNYRMIIKHAPLIFDTRNASKNMLEKNIVRL